MELILLIIKQEPMFMINFGRKHKVNQHEICDYLKYWRAKSGWSTKKLINILDIFHTAGHWFRKDNNSVGIPNPNDWRELKNILGFDDKYDKQVTELELKPITFEQSDEINNWDTPSDTITATGPEDTSTKNVECLFVNVL